MPVVYRTKYKKNCLTCRASKNDAKLRQRIKHATYDRDVGDETLADIAIDLHISKIAVYNHAKKHIKDVEVSNDQRAVRVAKKVADIKTAAMKKIELSIDHEDIVGEPESVMALKEYITQGHALVKEGKLNITAQSFLQAVGKDIDYESKKKDREVDIIKTMYRFASGEKKEADAKATTNTTGDVNSGQDGPGDIHNEDAGDAVAQWAAQLSPKYPKAEDPNQLADLQQPLG